MVYLLNLCFYILAEALRKALTILINAISQRYILINASLVFPWSPLFFIFFWEESQERQMQLEKIFGQMSED